MYTLITVIHIFVALLLIGIVLFQADEGSGLGGAFGTSMAGSSGGSMFGKKGAVGVLTRFTAILVTIFFDHVLRVNPHDFQRYGRYR